MTRSRPNVVIIHWHDLGRHLRCYGLPSVTSPAVDRLAEQGVRFAQAFAAAPLCSPARSALFTGQYPHQTGIMGLTHLGWHYREGRVTLPEMFAEHGYHTALAGLQHESEDASTIGFDETFSCVGEQRRAPVVASAAADWISRRHVGDPPFLLTVGFSEVHRPYPLDLYKPDDPATVDVPSFLPDNSWTRDDLACFQGSIRVADFETGRILEALDLAGLADNTIVVFTTDHGIAFPGAKSTLYDAGLGVAMVIRTPAELGGVVGVKNDLASHVDLVPTLLDLCGLPERAGLEGLSHAGSLTGGKPAGRSRVFAEKTYHDCYDPIRAVRSADWKYIRNFESRPRLILPVDVDQSATRYGFGAGGDPWLSHRPEVELYRLTDDPLERTNMIDDPSCGDIAQELADDLLRWQHATRDPLLSGAIPCPPRPRLARFGALPDRGDGE